MPVTIYGIGNCDTIKKARRWLDANDVEYRFHDYKIEGIEKKQIAAWSRALGWEALLNRSGTTFRNLDVQDKAGLDEPRAIALMLRQPSMIKRPLLDRGDAGYILGFDPDRYARAFSAAPVRP